MPSKNKNLDPSVATIVALAGDRAHNAAEAKWREMYEEHGDMHACGFAWVSVYGVRSNSKIGKALATLGFTKSDWNKCLQLWNPGKYMGQSVDIKEEAARAYANELTALTGIECFVGSRLD